jgi:hypothetical protein
MVRWISVRSRSTERRTSPTAATGSVQLGEKAGVLGSRNEADAC